MLDVPPDSSLLFIHAWKQHYGPHEHEHPINRIYIYNNRVWSFLLASKKLVLDEAAVRALWCRSLSSLEAAALSLLETVLSESSQVMQNLERVVSDSLLVSQIFFLLEGLPVTLKEQCSSVSARFKLNLKCPSSFGWW